jgi:hypothetical protein
MYPQAVTARPGHNEIPLLEILESRQEERDKMVSRRGNR